MTAITVQAREMVHTKLNESKDSFVVSDYNLYQGYSLREQAEDLGTTRIDVILFGSEDTLKTRAGSYQKEIPIQVAVRKQVDSQDTGDVDQLIELLEQLQHSLRLVCTFEVPHIQFTTARIQWLRTEPMKDENGLPLEFVFLENGIFFSYFTLYFTTTIKG